MGALKPGIKIGSRKHYLEEGDDLLFFTTTKRGVFRVDKACLGATRKRGLCCHSGRKGVMHTRSLRATKQ